MGHVPSKEVSSKPFLADLQTAKGGVDRLIAASVTPDNFPSAEDPLFKQFVALRCDPSVLHWFNVQNPNDRTVLPPPPTAEYLYKKHVVEPAEQLKLEMGEVERSASGEEDFYAPIPIALFRLSSSNHTKAQAVDQWAPIAGGAPFETIRDIVAAGEEVQLVGYLGCRGGSKGSSKSSKKTTTAATAAAEEESSGAAPPGPVLSVFLDKTFWNEAKSISIFQIAAKCYEHFSAQIGKQPKWPTNVRARCLDTNLPTLRLVQAIFRLYHQTGVDVQHGNSHVTLSTHSEVLVNVCKLLASSVNTENFPGTRIHRRFHLDTQRPGPSATTAVPLIPTPFDTVVERAKALWKENNALVVAAKKDIEMAEKEQAEKEKREAAAARGDAYVASGDGSGGNSRSTTPQTSSILTVTPQETPSVSPQHLASGPIIGYGGVLTNGIAGGKNGGKNGGKLPASATTIGPYASIYAPTLVAAGVKNLMPTKFSPAAAAPPVAKVKEVKEAAASPQMPPPPMSYQEHQQHHHQQQFAVAAPLTAAQVPGGAAQTMQQRGPAIQVVSPPPQQQQQQQQPLVDVVRLPFQAPATVLLPTATSGVLQPFGVQWVEASLDLKPSAQRSQHAGMLLELVSRPSSGAINVIVAGGQAMSTLPLPDPCYINVTPGTPVFIQFQQQLALAA